jgi:hypothetical protein
MADSLVGPGDQGYGFVVQREFLSLKRWLAIAAGGWDEFA